MSVEREFDISTTPDQEPYQQLRFHFANQLEKATDRQVDPDLMDWALVKNDGKTCEFSYRDDKVELTKVVSLNARPYELNVSATVTNRASQPLKHALTVNSDAWRYEHEVKPGAFRQSPLTTQVECIHADGKATRLTGADFEPKDFENRELFPKNSRNPGSWLETAGQPALAAVSNAYFTHSLVPLTAPGKFPVCQAQIQERYAASFGSVDKDPNGGALYRVRLAYPAEILDPGQSANYTLTSYSGPMERSLLAAAVGGNHSVDQLIDLGYFSPIAKILVAFLLNEHGLSRLYVVK